LKDFLEILTGQKRTRSTSYKKMRRGESKKREGGFVEGKLSLTNKAEKKTSSRPGM
jgi:hypothetical protein